MTIVAVIPARWASSRLPGKPLVPIAGTPMINRVIQLARRALRDKPGVDIVVAADDDRVAEAAARDGCAVVMTDPALASGSDRAWAAARSLNPPPSHVVNIQGDAPLMPAQAISGVVDALLAGATVATPVVRLSWEALDALRLLKQRSPFSGTTCIVGAHGEASWFSKVIIPAIRDEDRLRSISATSPVFQHLGLYGYALNVLDRFHGQAPGYYERLEGLEQLRFLEMGVPLRVVEISPATSIASGIDTPVDVANAERWIERYGDPFGS